MKLGKLKWLKIVGIIAVVAGVLALAVWGIISILNKEKVYLSAFAGEIEKEIDEKTDCFETLETKSPELYDFVDLHLTPRFFEEKNITTRLNIAKNNFAVIGFNSQERKNIDKTVASLTKYRSSLASIYLELDSIANKEVITSEDVTTFKNIFKESYLTNFDLIVKEKLNLLNILNASLNKHNITQSDYLASLNELSDFAVYFIQTFNIPHITKYGKAEASTEYSYELITKLNTQLNKIKQNTKSYNNENLASLIAGLKKETASLKQTHNEFLTAFNSLTEVEIQTLSNGGEGFDYTITPVTPNLTAVVNFLKVDGTFHNFVKSGSDLMKGIVL